MGTVVRTEKVTKVLHGAVDVTLVRDVSLEINEGEFVVITGPSGSGKSSLLYLIGLLDVPSSGDIWLNGQKTGSLREQELSKTRLAEIGFVFQFHFLLPEFTALENVMLPMQKLKKHTPEEIRRRAKDLLVRLGLGDQFDKLPSQLSGGQSQRVAIARALSNEPHLILADEPTGNLDSAASSIVQNILKELAHEDGHAVVVVTHDQQFAKEADRVLTIVDGGLT